MASCYINGLGSTPSLTLLLCPWKRRFSFFQATLSHSKGAFPLRAWKRAFFVSFIDLSALKIEASVKQSEKINTTNKE